MTLDLEQLLQQKPYIHPNAVAMGMYQMMAGSSLWPGVVVRADMGRIVIGKGVNIQDNSVLHVDSHHSIEIGDFSLVGHKAMIHGAQIGKACMIGIGCMILDDAQIGNGAQITAGCTIRGGKKIPARSLVVQKGNELKIFPEKAKPMRTIMGSIEYMLLAKRAQNNEWGPFSEDMEHSMKLLANQIWESINS